MFREVIRPPWRRTIAIALVAACAIAAAVAAAVTANSASARDRFVAATPSVPNVTVKFGMEPYPPHTSAIIGLSKGWFKDVGVNLKWQNLQATAVGPALVGGTVDVASAAPALLVPSMAHGSFKTFVFNDLFEAYALMAAPNSKFKTYAQFRAMGQSPAQAMKSACAQMKGHTFTQAGEGAEKPFIDLILATGGLTASDVKTVIAPDPSGVALMLAGRADFEIGGLPARITLEQHHFKDIITAADIAAGAKASPNSPALVAITHVGWTSTTSWAQKNYDTALRVASVAFREVQFQHDHAAAAIAIHTPFLNKLAGSTLKQADMKVIYSKLDPVYTWQMQGSTFFNPKSPLYWGYEVQADINSFAKQGVFKPGQFKAGDISIAEKVYRDLALYRSQATAALAKLHSPTGQAAKFAAQAKHYFAIFDYLDAAHFAQAAVAAKG